MITTLGRSGLRVTRIGLGLAALGRPGYINLGHAVDVGGDTEVAALERQAHAVLDAAYAGGVRYFDAARSYGTAEAFLGQLARAARAGPRRRHGRLEVGLHVHGRLARGRRGARGQGAERGDAAPSAGREPGAARGRPAPVPDPLRHARERRAGRSRGARGARAAAGERAVRSGSPRAGPDRPRRSSGRSRSGGFDSVQATWNLLEPSAGPALAAAHAAGLGVIVKEALANGRLTGSAATSAGARRGGPAAPAPRPMRWRWLRCWPSPGSDVVLSGAATVEQLESNLAALEVERGAARRPRRGP